jgi:hypothetical protein
LSRTSCFLGGSLDQDALVEPGASTDQRDEVECVDGAPAAFGGLDDLERPRAAAAPAGRAALSLVSGADAPLKQTLLALRGGVHLAEHDAPGAATLQVLQGRVRLVTSEQRWELGPGDHLQILSTRHWWRAWRTLPSS